MEKWDGKLGTRRDMWAAPNAQAQKRIGNTSPHHENGILEIPGEIWWRGSATRMVAFYRAKHI